jgi:hypothetical protein
MLDGLKAEFRQLKDAPAGHRFIACYERHQAREAPWLKPILFFAAIFSLVIGVILAFIPGPAILFFAISAALLAAESRVVAAAFDNVECWCRERYAALRGRRGERKKRQARATTKALSPQAVAVIAARAERAKEEQTRRDLKRPSVRGSAEVVPQPGAPQHVTGAEAAAAQPDANAADANAELNAAETEQATPQHAEPARSHPGAQGEQVDANAAPAQAGAKPPPDTLRDGGASAAAELQRNAVVPPVAKPTAAAKPGARATQAYAPNMQTRARQVPARVAGTVKLWAGDLPTPQPSSNSTARLRRPRKRATKPSIVTLPPPVVIGVEKT